MAPLSSLIRDPMVRAAFERAERDNGAAFAVPCPPVRDLDGGNAEPIPQQDEAAS